MSQVLSLQCLSAYLRFYDSNILIHLLWYIHCVAKSPSSPSSSQLSFLRRSLCAHTCILWACVCVCAVSGCALYYYFQLEISATSNSLGPATAVPACQSFRAFCDKLWIVYERAPKLGWCQKPNECWSDKIRYGHFIISDDAHSFALCWAQRIRARSYVCPPCVHARAGRLLCAFIWRDLVEHQRRRFRRLEWLQRH